MEIKGKKFRIEKGVTAELVHLGTCDEGLTGYFILLVPHFEDHLDDHMTDLEKIAKEPIIDSANPTTVYSEQGIMFFFDTDIFFGKEKKKMLDERKNYDGFIQSVSTRIRRVWKEAKQSQAAFRAITRKSIERAVAKKLE